jgi:RNA polymerase subunit RPABC4/transcription elongation factor Spt4
MSALTPCPACKNQVSSEAEACPKCGHKLKEKQTATGILAAIVIGLIGGAIVIMMVKQ